MKVRLVVAARQLQDYYREGIMRPMGTRRHDKPTAALRSDQTCESCDLFVLRHWPRHTADYVVNHSEVMGGYPESQGELMV